MYYFLLTNSTVDFAAAINDGVKPTVLDENGGGQFFVVHDDLPNEIISLKELKERYEGKAVTAINVWH